MNVKPPLRVLLVAPSQGGYGGIEAVVLAQAQSLLDNPDFAVRVCFKLTRGATFGGRLRAECEAVGAPHEVVARASLGLLRNLRWADVIHAHNAPPDVVLGARLLRRPIVLTVHNHRRSNGSMHEKLWTMSLRLADRRCYISDFVRRSWEPAGPQPGSVIMPSLSRLPPESCSWQRTGFFFIGRWIENKGLEELLDAYAGAAINHAEWPLTLAGDGPLRPRVEELVKSRKLATVRLAGFLAEEEKFSQMGGAKWNVAPPHTNEDLGLTPIEARRLAVPSIITRDGGLPEAAGPEALVAEPGDVAGLCAQLEAAAAMPEEEYRRRSLACQAQLREFLVPLSEYHRLYRELAKAR